MADPNAMKEFAKASSGAEKSSVEIPDGLDKEKAAKILLEANDFSISLIMKHKDKFTPQDIMGVPLIIQYVTHDYIKDKYNYT